MRKIRLNQRGDTIIEVLIAVAVISLVLAAAYAITNRNTANTLDTQEHNQAQQIVQRQIESLRALAGVGPIALSDGVTGCVTGDGSGLQINTNNDGSCLFSSGGTAGHCTVEPCYNVGIKRNVTLDVYEVTATWNSVKGDRSSVSMEYGI